ncbi:DUF5134 domain-containing protein [Streptomyces hyaluromycini]|uniref:DUF5134 domain-containing protein n=1 Tax=Streptomyces hyaluromycini TaxID=1377993 RepID=UPI000B5CDF4D|nr:DUF5134 domain-containing protein [Streptomyces hyaluromycini]
MSATDVVYCMLTALFTAAAVRALRHALVSRSLGWRSRVDHLLHTAMALAMAVMPWNCGPGLPELPQTVFFAAAALWFPLTAAGCPQRSRPTATARRLPYAVGMAAMAWMTLSMASPSHEPVAEGLPSERQAVNLGHSAGESKAGTVVTGVLALYLLVSALRSLTRGMPTLRGVSDAVAIPTGTRGPYGGFWDGSMALGTVIMLLVHP